MDYLLRPENVEPKPLGESHPRGLCRPLITQDRLPTERTTIGLRTYEPGGSSHEQQHADRELALFLLEGSMAARVGGAAFVAEIGDLVFVPRATPYSFANEGRQPLSFLHIAVALNGAPASNAQRRGVHHLRASEIEPVLVGGTHKNMTSRQCIRPQRVDTERMALDISTYAAGGGNRPLAHTDAEQVYYVMAGTMRAFVADKQYDGQPGDIIFIPRNTLHWHENAKDSEMTYMLIGVILR